LVQSSSSWLLAAFGRLSRAREARALGFGG
jgi:hypothetical protein